MISMMGKLNEQTNLALRNIGTLQMQTKEYEGAAKTFRKLLRRYVMIHGEEYAEIQGEYEDMV
jgi:hypothetical protein